MSKTTSMNGNNSYKIYIDLYLSKTFCSDNFSLSIINSIKKKNHNNLKSTDKS